MPQEHQQRDPSPPDQPTGGRQMDAAHRSLADALHLSFRLLSLIMIVVLVALLLTGLSQVQPDERGVRMLFGRIQGEGDARVLEEGLGWSWPEPLGRVVKVHTGQRKVVLDDFWYHETSKHELDPESIPMSPSEGLRPGWDGALLTGDRALLHVKFTCNYRIGLRNERPDADAIIKYLSNTIDPEKVIRAAVCNAAIRAAAIQTVDSILTTGKETFRQNVQELAQRRLEEMASGIRIEAIEIGSPQVPLAAIMAFDAVNSARQEAQTRINQAIGDANRMLERTAGRSWKKLVRAPNLPGGEDALLSQYARLRERGNEAEAEKILEEIDRVLLSNETTGAAASIINEAKKYSASIRQRVASRANDFEQLIDQFLATPDLMVQKLWAEAKEEILTSPTIEQYYLTTGQKLILRYNQDPEVRRRLLEQTLKAGREEDKTGRGRPGP